MKINGKRWIGWALAALALGAFVVWAFWPRPAEVDMATVERRELVVTLDEEGETRVRERYVVSAPVAGKVLRIELEPGDAVTAGETVVAVFQPSDPVPLDARSRAEAEARVRSAEAAQRSARARAEAAAAAAVLASAELERIRALADDGIASQAQLDSAAAAARSRREERQAAEQDADRARYELEQAQAVLLEAAAHGGNPGVETDPLTLTAPVDGVVLRRMRESESVVAAGEPLLELGDPAQLEIVADYLSTDAVRIGAGDRVVIDRWGGDRPLTGRVRRVEPSGFLKISALGVEEQRVNVIVDFDSPRRAFEALGDNYRVEVRAVVWEADEVLQVPTSALFRHGEAWAAFAVEEGRAVRRQVEVGHRNNLAAEVVDGLAAGARVIVHPSDSLADGIEVKERPSS